LGLVALILVVGFLVWLFEREKNAGQFGGGMAKGIGAGFWWATVTMTTVGYGDKAPQTLRGRVVAIMWMFSAMVIVATFTGMVASSLTIHHLTTAVRGLNDLPHLRVGTVAESTSEAFLRRRHMKYRAFGTSLEGLNAVARNNLDAFVYDAPMLRYQANIELEGKVAVLTGTFDRQDYAFALPKNSPWRKPFNQILLQTIDEPQWKDTLYHYLGEQEANDGL
jgi:polar amino acid transport system substrate-binding protein